MHYVCIEQHDSKRSSRRTTSKLPFQKKEKKEKKKKKQGSRLSIQFSESTVVTVFVSDKDRQDRQIDIRFKFRYNSCFLKIVIR